jgi:hypothetical protein
MSPKLHLSGPLPLMTDGLKRGSTKSSQLEGRRPSVLRAAGSVNSKPTSPVGGWRMCVPKCDACSSVDGRLLRAALPDLVACSIECWQMDA